MFKAGVGKANITAFKKGVGMMGYGMYFNYVRGVETNLFSRAVVMLDKQGKKIVFVNAEICFITVSIKLGVMKKLERLHPEYLYTKENVMLSAQHTHSGPGGYSHYGMYNFTIPGFVPEVYQTIVEGIVKSIVEAEKNLVPARIKYANGEFEPEKEVAFNRSIEAYNANPEVSPLSKKDHHLALERRMDLLRIENEGGQAIACINWFGVHTTSLSNDNKYINWDNKGYAADFLEKEIRPKEGTEDFMALFAQQIAGDVTPNYIYDRKKRWTRGKFKDDVESAKYNGSLQFEKAKVILEAAKSKDALDPKIDHALSYSDFSDIEVDADFTNGEKGLLTSPGCIGVDMMAGTVEGPGMPFGMSHVAKLMTLVIKWFEYISFPFISSENRNKIKRKYKSQHPKSIIIETGERKLLGTRNVKRVVIPGVLDPTIMQFKKDHRNGGLDNKPWSPQTLPLQIFTIGNIAIAGIPAEITTIAGKRLRNTIQKELSNIGIHEVILCTYVNAYSGYITTQEEYELQLYEGGHTVFGKWTLAAFQTKFRELAHEMCKQSGERKLSKNLHPAHFTEEELSKRSFTEAFKINQRKEKRFERKESKKLQKSEK